MTDILYIKRNDLQPYYYARVVDDEGEVVNINNATITCTMKDQDAGTLKIDRQSVGITITDASNGLFQYEWQDGDTDTSGVYEIEFEIVPVSGGKFTLPSDPDDIAIVTIVADFDNS